MRAKTDIYQRNFQPGAPALHVTPPEIARTWRAEDLRLQRRRRLLAVAIALTFVAVMFFLTVSLG